MLAPPAAPGGLAAKPGNQQVALSWQAAGGASSYNVLYSTGGDYLQAGAGIKETQFVHQLAVNGTAYTYVVQAVSGGGTSANSASVQATPAALGGAAPAFIAAGVTNGASFASGLTPGGIATIFGVNLSNGFHGIANAGTLPLPTELVGASVTIGGILAPMFAVANIVGGEQLNLQVPYEIAGQTSVPVVVNNGAMSNAAVMVPVAAAQPGIFTTDGVSGVIVHGADSTLVTPAHPALPSEVLVMYATGCGPVAPTPGTGEAAPTVPLSLLATPPTVTVGGVNAHVSFSGLTPDLAGLNQINFTVPVGAASGNQDVVLTANGAASKTVKLAVQ